MNDAILKDLYDALTAVCSRVLIHESMAAHTTFRIGGAAACVAIPANKEELLAVLAAHRRICPDLPLCVLGNGSNVVFSDEGFQGLVVLTGQVRRVQIRETPTEDGHVLVEVDSGVSLTGLAGTCMRPIPALGGQGLSGLSFAYGIPGCIGGGIVMNAGAYGGEMSDVVVFCDYYDAADGTVHRLTRDELDFSYRHSIFSDHPSRVILGATLALRPGDAGLIRAEAEAHMAARKEKQPLEYPNAGSVFKRPEGHFAGKLIEDCGLKGYTVGGAQVSEKHAGFIINRGGATASDVKTLVAHIRLLVLATQGVDLVCEIRFIE